MNRRLRTADPLTRRRSARAPFRPAVVLLIVLVVIVALSLSAYTFTDLMLANRHATQVHGKRIQARYLVESGVEKVKLYLSQDVATQAEMGGHFNNPLFFQGNVVIPDLDLQTRGGFTVLSPYYDESLGAAGLRYGLDDESTRLNLNVLLAVDSAASAAGALAEGTDASAAAALLGGTDAASLSSASSSTGRTLLLGLPGMTEDVADAILDWMDEDEEPREYGAEAEYYSGLNPPYAPRNGPLQTVEELLLVRGVTPQLLFGLDTNRNGLIDPHETSMGGNGSGRHVDDPQRDPDHLRHVWRRDDFDQWHPGSGGAGLDAPTSRSTVPSGT